MHEAAISTVQTALSRYADQLKRAAERRVTTSAQPEDQLKAPVKELVETIGESLNLKVESDTEAPVEGVGRPDIAILKDGLLIGYIELKAPEIDIAKMSGRDLLQLKRFRAIPNLIYTNGSDWMFYRRKDSDAESQVQRAYSIRMDGILEDGAKAVGDDHPQDFIDLFREFLEWEPIVPRTAKGLAEQLAPLTRLLRDDVTEAVNNPNGKALKGVYEDWKRTLFPDATVEEFADSYAQTVTYGLLLARISGSHVLSTMKAAQAIAQRSGLLARTLEVLTQDGTRQELGASIGLLERTIDKVDPGALESKGGTDPWLYFYEDFLAVYDPALRNRRGVYYTPAQVVQAQVRLVDDALRTHLGRPDGIAADDVTILDPALGTGTYLLTALQYGAEQGAERYGPGAKGNIASKMVNNLYGFELLVGPYAVAHVRLSQLLQELGGTEPAEGMNVYLTDTLESPHEIATLPHSYFEEPLAEERRRAREVKSRQQILVCIGNPPYERSDGDNLSKADDSGGWIRFGDNQTPAPLETFLEPARKAGAGLYLRNLYNAYVYFWRWALWKTLESQSGPGIVSFITASSYLTGKSFVGMREELRRAFDKFYVIDLGGDSRGTRVSENVFDIRTPVAIAIGVRATNGNRSEPADVLYASLSSTRAEMFQVLEGLKQLSELEWQSASSGWTDSFVPKGKAMYWGLPEITLLFPWNHVGIKLHRTWPIAPTGEELEDRWHLLMASSDRAGLFRETRDRNIGSTYEDQIDNRGELQSIASLSAQDPIPPVDLYGYRTFDLQRIFRDTRVGDRNRPPLWKSMSDSQLFMTTLVTESLSNGHGVSFSPAPVDMNHFNNRNGKAIPLYRDAAATQPNITEGLLSLLVEQLEFSITPEDLMSFVAGIMGSPAYTSTFEEELATPGPRIPITKDGELFQRVVEVGKQVIAWQTYARRFPEAIGTSQARVPQGSARIKVGIPETPELYPESMREVSYNETTRELKVGEGVIEDVAPAVFNYEVSGFKVVRSWLGYRVKNRQGRKSSPLDDIRPEHWSWEMTQGLLELLWAVEAVVNLEPLQAELLEEVLAGEVFLEEELPTPTDAERKAPSDRAAPLQQKLL